MLRNNLTEYTMISKALIVQRINQIFVVENGHGGISSPLSGVELSIIDMLILLSRMRESYSPSAYILLINNLVDGTEIQKAPILFKKKHLYGTSVKGGLGYLYGFKARNSEKYTQNEGKI